MNLKAILSAVATALFSTSCVQSHAHVQAPSTAAVQAGINRAQSGVTSARNENQALGQGNAQARTLEQRIHDKDILIDRWYETHPGE
jgi:hypothetical protein